MKRFFYTIALAGLLFFAFCGTGYTLSVTYVESPSTGIATGVAPSKQPIILTFGSERVVVHEKGLRIPGVSLSDSDIALSKLFLIRDHRAVSKRTEYETIYQHGPFRLAIVHEPGLLTNVKHVGIQPITRSMIVTEVPKGPPAKRSVPVEEVLKKIDQTRYGEYLSLLAGNEDLPTRYACSPQAMTARDIIVEAFEEIELDELVTDQKFSIPSGACEWRCQEKGGLNVVGKIIGKNRPNDYYVVGAHYDSITDETNPCKASPGANDNASGVAGVLELANVFNEFTTDASIIFVAFGGEELDLYGSKKFVNKIVKDGERKNIKSFVVLDMISYYKGKQKIYVEGGKKTKEQKQAVDMIVANTTTYTDLAVEYSYDFQSENHGNSDHVSFLKEKMPGALIIEWDSDTYPYTHTSKDNVKYQQLPYAIEVLKVAAATLAQAGVNTQETRKKKH